MTSPDPIAEIEKRHEQVLMAGCHADRGFLLQALAASQARVKEAEEELTRLQRLVCDCPRTYNDGVNMDRPHQESCPVVNRDWKHNIHPQIWQGEIIAKQTARIAELERAAKKGTP